MLLEGEPERYGAWAARWAARFVHEAAGADVDEAAFVLAALIALRGRARPAAARALEELCELGGQKRSAQGGSRPGSCSEVGPEVTHRVAPLQTKESRSY